MWGIGDFGSSAARLLEDLDYKKSCYLVYDETPEFTHNRKVRSLLRRTDDDVTKAVDFVLATSKSQQKARLPLNPQTHYVPNGVDLSHFAIPVGDDARRMPFDLEHIPKPILGFSGWMGYQLDLELLTRLADEYPDGSIVLVGPDSDIPGSAALTALRQRENVHWLGAKKPVELADYIWHFDAALIPYVMQGHTRYIYPLKLHEYLAMGRAVVATDLPNLHPHRDVVRIAHDHDQFIELTRVAIGDYAPDAVEARVLVATEYSWDDRVDEIGAIIAAELGNG